MTKLPKNYFRIVKENYMRMHINTHLKMLIKVILK